MSREMRTVNVPDPKKAPTTAPEPPRLKTEPPVLTDEVPNTARQPARDLMDEAPDE